MRLTHACFADNSFRIVIFAFGRMSLRRKMLGAC
jgi:hypothetical protein